MDIDFKVLSMIGDAFATALSTSAAQQIAAEYAGILDNLEANGYNVEDAIKYAQSSIKPFKEAVIDFQLEELQKRPTPKDNMFDVEDIVRQRVLAKNLKFY